MIPETTLTIRIQFAFAAIVVIRTGCVAPRRPSASVVVQPSNTPPQQVKGRITIWSWNIAAEALVDLIPAFNKKYPGIDAHVEMTGARMEERMLLSLASGVGAP